MGARYGQHFLRSRRAIEAILARFAAGPDDRVVEIGPGRGALTLPIARRVGSLAAIEVDALLAGDVALSLGVPVLPSLSAMPALSAGAGGILVLRADALELRYGELARLLGADENRRLRVIANLPYQIATALIRRMLAERNLIDDALLMVQKEVACRLLASPGQKSYGYLAVRLALAGDRESVLTLGPGAFSPPPKVRSTVVALRFRHPPGGFELEDSRLDALLKIAFSERRKKLAANLARGYAIARARAAERLLACDADPDARAEDLAPETFARLASGLPSAPPRPPAGMRGIAKRIGGT